MVALPPVVAARWPSRASASFSARTISPRTRRAIAETHFGLGRMHIHVHFPRIKRNKKGEQWMPVARQIVGIGCAHRAIKQLVAHRPSIDEQILPKRIGARERRQAGKAGHAHAFTFGVDGNGVGAEVRAEHVAEPRELAAFGRGPPGHWRPFFAGKREGNVGPAHGQPPHDFAHGFGLTAVGFQEFQSRRRSKEQVTHLDGGALGRARLVSPPTSLRHRRQCSRHAARWRGAW